MNISLNNVLSALFIYAPQFYTVDPTVLAGYDVLYNLISCQINQQILSCCGVSVYAFLMAHYLTLAANPNLGITREIHEGDLSLGYNVNPEIQALDLTPYGRSYLDLVSRTVVGSTVTNLPVVFGGVIQNMPTGCGCGSGLNGGWGGGWGYGNGGGGCC